MYRVLYEDTHLIACQKPAGLFTHHSRLAKGEDSLHAQLSDLKGQVFPLHRLDRATSGVLLFARSKPAASAFGRLFMADARGITKVYLALTRGWLSGDEGVIDHPLKSLSHSDQRLQPAVSHYKVLGRLELDLDRLEIDEAKRVRTSRYSLLQMRIETGRTHQIRRHLKHLHHPIIGDSRYGKGDQNRLFRAAFGLDQLCLHSAGISLIHPFTNQKIEILSDLEMLSSQWGGCFDHPACFDKKRLQEDCSLALRMNH
jgi:tRNA pseudouridine65 synthase